MVFDVNKLNALIEKASNVLSCDANCQKNEQIVALRQKIKEAVDNQTNASQNIDNAVKDYIIYSKGAPVFKTYESESLNTDADSNAADYQKKFDTLVQETTTNLDSYSTLLLNYKNVNNSYLMYTDEYIRLLKQVNEITGDVDTNNRKTYYEDENIKSLDYYYSIFRLVYIIVVCVFIYLFFRGSYSAYSFWPKLIVLGLLIANPFFATRLLTFFINLYNQIVQVLPNLPYKKTV